MLKLKLQYLDHLMPRADSLEKIPMRGKIESRRRRGRERMRWRGRWEGDSGWGTHTHPWLIHVSIWQNPLQYCKVISLQLKKKKMREKK